MVSCDWQNLNEETGTENLQNGSLYRSRQYYSAPPLHGCHVIIQDAEKGTWTGMKSKRSTIGVTSASKKNAQTSRRISEDELSNGKEGCLGRRCKNYRKRAMMSANHDSNMTNTSVPQEEISELEVSELVKPINFETEWNNEE